MTTCRHDLPADWCSFCKPPSPVLARGYRARGGAVYHNDPRCPLMYKDLRYSVAKCADLREVVIVIWTRTRLLPCEHCCTRDWIHSHQRPLTR